MRGAQIPGSDITFHYRAELGSWRLRPALHYKLWLIRGIAAEGRRSPPPQIAHLAYYFIPPAEMSSLHEKLLGEATPTDIITLDYRETSGDPLLAEIYVCPKYVRSMARLLRRPYGEELRRVLAHGILHLLGYRDDTPEGRLRMRAAEERWLSLWKTTRPVSHETSRL